jgi:CRP-like cAMP-binding protein
MAESKLLEAVSAHPFFKGMSDQHLRLLASGAVARSYGPGEYLGREGQPADNLFLIESGYVSLETHASDRGVVALQRLGPGHAVGWSWLVPPHRWRFDFRASEAVKVLAFEAQWMRDRCDEDHELGYCLLKHLIGVMAGRLAATRLQLLDVHC